MRSDVEERIAAAASPQHGVVSRAQLLAAGLSRWTIHRRVEAGRLRPLFLGTYVLPGSAAPRAREMAAVLSAGPGAVLSYMSAAQHWRLRVDCNRAGTTVLDGSLGSPPAPADDVLLDEPVDVSVAGVNRGRRPGIRIHRVRNLGELDRTVHHGIPITTPARTLVDIAGLLGRRELELAVARAERERLIERDALFSYVARHTNRRGVATLRRILAAPGGPVLTRSEAEARFLELVREARLPPPEVNVRIGSYELDFLWRAAGLAVEVDGFQHHGSRAAFERDRARDAWLLASGIAVLRLSWRQIAHQSMATAVRLGQALAHASASGVAGPRIAMGPTGRQS